MSPSRRLVVILFTDVVGYSAMMQRNEFLALSIAKKHEYLVQEAVAKYNGKVSNFMGDGSLCEFMSASEALHAALMIQTLCQQEDPRIPLRVGVHMGEITEANGRIYGDVVNIASRIESLGISGSILLSKSVRNQIQNKGIFKMVKLGPFMFKNINEPIDIYAVSNTGIVVPDKNGLTGISTKINKKKLSRRIWISIGTILLILFLLEVFYFKKSILQESELTEQTANKPDQQKSIAILPFQNLSAEKEFSFFSEGMVDNILTKLGKLQELHVISRSSSKFYANSEKTLSEIASELGVTFILEGSMQKYGNHIRINAQLIDVYQDKQLWADQYDRELKDIFQLQNEVSIKIIEALKINLSSDMKNSLAETSTENLQAWENFVLSKELISQRTSEKLIQGIDLVELALTEDPNFAEAMTLQAEALFVCGRFGYLDRNTSFVKARKLISKALSINHKMGGPYAVLGVLDFDEGRWEDCLKNCEQALIYAPNDPLPNRSYSYCFGSITKDWNQMVEFARKGHQLDPLSPINFYKYLIALLNAGRLNDLETEIRANHVSFERHWMEMQFNGHSSATQGNFEEAIQYLKSAIVLNPENEMIKSDLGFCLGKIGKSEEAKAILDKLNIDSPNFHLHAAIIYSGMGDLEAAFANLEIKFAENITGIIDMLASYKSIPLQIDGRFKDFIEKMNLHNYWNL